MDEDFPEDMAGTWEAVVVITATGLDVGTDKSFARPNKEVSMGIHWKRLVVGLTFTLIIFVFGFVIGYTEEQGGIEGWERDSTYNAYYDLVFREKLRGVVTDIRTITPLPGMAPGVGLLVESPRYGAVSVQLGPRSFVDLNSIWNLRGAKVKVRGVWAEIRNEKVFIAYKLKSDKLAIKLRRTRDGTPLWTMSPQELAEETAIN
jgi:hypothetical protein